MTVRLEGSIRRWVGLSSDTKPSYLSTDDTGRGSGFIPPGSSFMETDTGRIWRYTGERWALGVTPDEATAAIVSAIDDLRQTVEDSATDGRLRDANARELALTPAGAVPVAPPMARASLAVPTLDTVAYAAGDTLSSRLMQFPDVVSEPGGIGTIVGLRIVDTDLQSVAGELWLFDTPSVTIPAANDAWSISDAHAERLACRPVAFSIYYASALNSIASFDGAIAFRTASDSRSLWGALVTRGAPTYTVRGLRVVLITADGVAGAGSAAFDSELPAALLLADNAATPTAPAVGAFGMVYDGVTWDMQRGDATDGTLVNLGANNDVTNTVLSVVGGGLEATAQRVTIASDSTGVVSVDDNASSLTIDNAALSVVGGGLEATALRVTLASDSTGLVSVDDNASSLTVDNTDITAAAVSLAVIDDWDETNRAAVNLIAGQVAITAGAGAVATNTPRATLASDDPAVAALQIMDDWDETNRAAVNTIAGQVGVQGASGAVTALTQRVVLATDVALPTGTNAIGKLATNSGVDIGDVDVLSIATGTNAIGRTGHDITGIADGRKVVTTAGTRETLAGSTTAKSVTITAETDNTGLVVVGGTTVVAALATRQGVPLNAGEDITIPCDNLTDINLDVTVSGDGVTFLYLT